jgi:hypothetical protein
MTVNARAETFFFEEKRINFRRTPEIPSSDNRDGILHDMRSFRSK